MTNKIMNAVCAECNVTRRQILESKRGTKRVAEARMIAMMLSCVPPVTTTKAAQWFGMKSHKSIQYAKERIQGLCETEAETRALVDRIKARINSI
jgi:chromosomal replication initiation ATPase DnaA